MSLDKNPWHRETGASQPGYPGLGIGCELHHTPQTAGGMVPLISSGLPAEAAPVKLRPRQKTSQPRCYRLGTWGSF